MLFVCSEWICREWFGERRSESLCMRLCRRLTMLCDQAIESAGRVALVFCGAFRPIVSAAATGLALTAAPAASSAPAAPTAPDVQTAPVAPIAPAAPTAPDVQTAPVAPIALTASDVPVLPAAPAAPAEDGSSTGVVYPQWERVFDRSVHTSSLLRSRVRKCRHGNRGEPRA